MVNIDTVTAFAFVSEGSSIRHQLKAFVGSRQMVMCQTAYQQFVGVVYVIGGPLEQARATKFLTRITVIPDSPSVRALNIKLTNSIEPSDLVIFGTGDNLGIITMTADAKFVRGTVAQGVIFDVFLHKSVPLIGR